MEKNSHYRQDFFKNLSVLRICEYKKWFEEMGKDLKKDVLGRIIEFKEYTGKSLNAFCASIGIAHTTVFGQVNGDRALSLDTVLKTVAAYDELSSDWLLRGRGEMIVANENISNANKYEERIEGLLETIQILSDTIRVKSHIIDALQAELSQLKNNAQEA